jgi:hypothetical protein
MQPLQLVVAWLDEVHLVEHTAEHRRMLVQEEQHVDSIPIVVSEDVVTTVCYDVSASSSMKNFLTFFPSDSFCYVSELLVLM